MYYEHLGPLLQYLYPELEQDIHYSVETTDKGPALLWWNSSTPRPSAKYLEGKIPEFKDHWAKHQAIKNRIKSYPAVADQLDMLWHSMDRGELTKVPEFYDKIKAVKDKYPKSQDKDKR